MMIRRSSGRHRAGVPRRRQVLPGRGERGAGGRSSSRL